MLTSEPSKPHKECFETAKGPQAVPAALAEVALERCFGPATASPFSVSTERPRGMLVKRVFASAPEAPHDRTEQPTA